MPPLGNSADLAHAHLLLNHVPTIGGILALGLLLLGLVRKNDHIQKVALEVIYVIALVTLPVYVSGAAAAQTLADAGGVSMEAMAAHNDAALASAITMGVTGFVAWFALWRVRREGRLGRGPLWTLLILTVVAVAEVAMAANMGGAIRHPEIEGGQYGWLVGSPGSPAPIISAAGVQAYEQSHPFAWPISETLHFLGMSLMFGVLMIVNFRLLGWLRAMSFASVHRLLPYGVIGFAINVITGMFFFVAKPEQYVSNNSFHWKILLLVLAGGSYLVLTVYDDAWALPAMAEAPLAGRALGASALVLWIGVMYFGRMLPYLGNSF